MDGAEDIDHVDFLAGSENRVRILESLGDDGPLERGTLREASDVARTTVKRNLDRLERRGWITETEANGDAYAITLAGEAVLEDFRSLTGTVRAVERLRPFLRWLPAGALDIDVRELADADVVVAGSSDPYAAVDRHVDRIETADEVRVLTGTVGRRALAASRRRVRDGADRHEIVVSAAAADVLRSDEYASLVADARETGRFAGYVYPDDVPFYLGVIDGVVQIGVEDDEGIPRALVETDSDAVRAWAEDRYRQCKRRADPLD